MNKKTIDFMFAPEGEKDGPPWMPNCQLCPIERQKKHVSFFVRSACSILKEKKNPVADFVVY